MSNTKDIGFDVEFINIYATTDVFDPYENENTNNSYDFDPKNMLYPGKIHSPEFLEIFVKSFLYVLILLTSLCGNMIVFVTIIRHRRMRTTTNMYMLNLAICDLLVTFMCMWVHLVDDITEGWILGSFFCTSNSFFQVASLIASTLTLTLIACDRFFGIVFAIKARMTDKRHGFFILFLWLIALVVASPFLFYRRQDQREWADHIEIWCHDQWPSYSDGTDIGESSASLLRMPSRKLYYSIVTVLLFFLPCMIMGFTYGFITFTLWSKKLPGESIVTIETAQQKKMKKVTIMLSLLVGVFIMCWLPFIISLLYAEYRPQYIMLPSWYKEAQFIAVFLSDANSALNPIIYTGFNQQFRKAFHDTLWCLRRKRPKWTEEPQHGSSRPYYYSMEIRHTMHTKTSVNVESTKLTFV